MRKYGEATKGFRSLIMVTSLHGRDATLTGVITKVTSLLHAPTLRLLSLETGATIIIMFTKDWRIEALQNIFLSILTVTYMVMRKKPTKYYHGDKLNYKKKHILLPKKRKKKTCTMFNMK